MYHWPRPGMLDTGAVSLKLFEGKLAPKPAYFILEKEPLSLIEATLGLLTDLYSPGEQIIPWGADYPPMT